MLWFVTSPLFYNDEAIVFGKKRLVKVVLFISIRLPGFICILDKLSNIDLYDILTVNKCYKNDHNAILQEDPSYIIMKCKVWKVGNHEPAGAQEFTSAVIQLTIETTKRVVVLIMRIHILEWIICLRMYSDMLQKAAIQLNIIIRLLYTSSLSIRAFGHYYA